ncbi:MAG: hypothetical protein PUH29_04165 [Lachnospiraceae bacterium]|nr:hypothetical protein [Lachnospiraceae bacterium]
MNKTRKVLSSRRGTSMVEVLAAFLIIVMMTAMFGRVVTLSMGMLQKSREKIAEEETFNSEYYKKENEKEQKKISGNLSLEGNGSSVPIPKGTLKKYTDQTTGLTRYFIEVVPQAESGEKNDEKTVP